MVEPGKRRWLRLQVGIIACYALALAGMLVVTSVSKTTSDKLISGFTAALFLFSLSVEIAKYRYTKRAPWRP